MKSLLDQQAWNEIKDRLSRLEEHSERQWGKMTPGQMARHCQYPLNIMLGHDHYNLKPNPLVNLLFKKSMYSDTLWRKNLPTVKRFRQVDPADFGEEVAKLNLLLDELGENRSKENWGDHPAFGKMTKEQWGKMQYKHLDHHLRQFGL